MRDPFFKCTTCGRYVSYTDFDNCNIDYYYTNDPMMEPEAIAHKVRHSKLKTVKEL